MRAQIYQPLNIFLVLVGVEVWTASDKIKVNGSDKSGTLDAWNAYRMQQINPYHYNDNGVLITYESSSISRCQLILDGCYHVGLLVGCKVCLRIGCQVLLGCRVGLLNYKCSQPLWGQARHALLQYTSMCFVTLTAPSMMFNFTMSHATPCRRCLCTVMFKHSAELKFFSRRPPQVLVGLKQAGNAFIAEHHLLQHHTVPAGVPPRPLDSLAPMDISHQPLPASLAN